MRYTLYLKSHLKEYKNKKIPLLQFDSKDPSKISYYRFSIEQVKCYSEDFWDVEQNRILALREDVADDIKNWDAFDCYPFTDWFAKNFAFLPKDLEWEKSA